MREIKFSFKEWLMEAGFAPLNWVEQLHRQLLARVTSLNHALSMGNPASSLTRQYQGSMSNWERLAKMPSNDINILSNLEDFQKKIARDIRMEPPVVGQELMNWWQAIESALQKNFDQVTPPNERPVVKQAAQTPKIGPVFDKGKSDSWMGKIFRKTG